MKEKIIQNPITDTIKQAFGETKMNLKIAVPFLTSFAHVIIEKDTVNNISIKKLITRFDETNINSFDIPTLEYLIDNGFEIHFDNNIHLKLYITDSRTFITSSNLTNGGFVKNKELTVDIDSDNIENCNKIFDKLWKETELNVISKKILKENKEKYLILKKREKFKSKKITKVSTTSLKTDSLNIQLLIDEIFKANKDYTNRLQLAYNANKLRDKTKRKILTKFDKILFYAPEGHKKRKKNLFYYFVHGDEEKLASTGLRESQFKDVFEHQDFEMVLSYILPEMIELEPWNLDDEKKYFEFCNGIFDFEIPQYSEVIPIRLASYFYPEHFVPIFKLDHLQKVCNALGLKTDAETKGEKLFAYNSYLRKMMTAIPYDNYIKSNMVYQILYSVELFNHLQKGDNYDAFKNSYKEIWKRNFIEDGKQLLMKIKAIK